MDIVWLITVWACLIWYSTITIFVAYKGGHDIRQMLHDLSADNDKNQVKK